MQPSTFAAFLYSSREANFHLKGAMIMEMKRVFAQRGDRSLIFNIFAMDANLCVLSYQPCANLGPPYPMPRSLGHGHVLLDSPSELSNRQPSRGHQP